MPAVLNDKEMTVLIQLDERIAELRKKQQQIIQRLAEKYDPGKEVLGAIKGVMKLETPDEKGRKFVRVKLIDNLSKFSTNEVLWKSAGVSRFEVTIEKLVNEPKGAPQRETPQTEPAL